MTAPQVLEWSLPPGYEPREIDWTPKGRRDWSFVADQLLQNSGEWGKIADEETHGSLAGHIRSGTIKAFAQGSFEAVAVANRVTGYVEVWARHKEEK